MRKISYIRTEFHAEDEDTENTLLAFIYDIPYFGACGIFPPFHILNEIFRSGGGGGGMSPGAIWVPFEITEKEYIELKNAVLSVEPMDLKEVARYCDIQFEFDSEFDNIQIWIKWMALVCEKHRESFHQKIRDRS
jgi:hypothetical protein